MDLWAIIGSVSWMACLFFSSSYVSVFTVFINSFFFGLTVLFELERWMVMKGSKLTV